MRPWRDRSKLLVVENRIVAHSHLAEIVGRVDQNSLGQERERLDWSR